MGFGQLHSEWDSWKKMCRPAGDGHVGVCGASSGRHKGNGGAWVERSGRNSSSLVVLKGKYFTLL